jgi:hypothetical protein
MAGAQQADGDDDQPPGTGQQQRVLRAEGGRVVCGDVVERRKYEQKCRECGQT